MRGRQWARPNRVITVALAVGLLGAGVLVAVVVPHHRDRRSITLVEPTESPPATADSPTPAPTSTEPSPTDSPKTIVEPTPSEAPSLPPEANGRSDLVRVSSTGRYVLFSSEATNLTDDATDAQWQVYRRDRVDDRTILVSRSLTGEPLRQSASSIAISGDGNVVAYVVYSGRVWYDEKTNQQVSGAVGLFVEDVRTATIRKVALPRDPTELSSMILSEDGRYATVSMRPYRSGMVYLLDLTNGTSTAVSVSSQGVDGNDDSWGGSMSSDHRYIVFESDATNLVPNDTNGARDVFLRDTVAGTTTRLSVAPNGDQLDGLSLDANISADGRTITFSSNADDFGVEPTCPIPKNFNFSYTPYVLDRETGELRSLYGENRDACSGPSAISEDGSRMLFGFDWGTEGVVDRPTGSMKRAFRCPADEPGEAGDEPGPYPVMSSNGRIVASPTICRLGSNDENHAWDIYAIDVDTDAIDRVSVPDGETG